MMVLGRYLCVWSLHPCGPHSLRVAKYLPVLSLALNIPQVSSIIAPRRGHGWQGHHTHRDTHTHTHTESSGRGRTYRVHFEYHDRTEKTTSGISLTGS